MTTYALYLESGPRRRKTMVHALDLLGCVAVGPTTEDALAATPDEVADRIMVAGTAEDWVRWLTDAYASAGLNHARVSFTGPFTPKAWAGIDIDGLPDLVDQVRLVGEQVLPQVSSL